MTTGRIKFFITGIFLAITCNSLAMEQCETFSYAQRNALVKSCYNRASQLAGAGDSSGQQPLWRRLCSSIFRGPCMFFGSYLRGRRAVLFVAAVLFIVAMVPRADASNTDAHIAGYESDVDAGWLEYSSLLCKELVESVGDLLRLNIRRCWPGGATHLTRDIASEFSECLGQNIGTVEVPSICARDMYALMDNYVDLIGRCMSQCMAPPDACLVRQFPPGVDPVERCMGHGCIHDCMSDLLLPLSLPDAE